MVGGRLRWGRARAVAVLALLMTACAATTPRSASPSATAANTGAGSPSVAPSAGNVVAAGEAWLAYQWMSGSGDGIFLVRPDGTGGHQLVTDLEGSEIHPDWSPDGQRIAFVHETADGRDALWVVNADGTGAEKLFSCDLPCNTISYPDWAPDGSAIYYGIDSDASAGPPTTFGVGRFDLTTKETRWVLTRKDEMTAEQPRISPDGTGVVYTRFNAVETATGSAIFVSDLLGGQERRLTDWTLWGAHPDWSAGGTIVFNTYDLGIFQDTTEPANLWTVAVDGTGLRQLTTFGDHDTRATQPRWTPDGSAIVFTRVEGEGFGTRRLAIINADGSEMRLATSAPISGTHPQLRPLPAA